MNASPDLSVFDDVDLWIFDLDNTLYPRPQRLWGLVHGRMQKFIIDLLGVDRPEAEFIQRDYFQRYGLTMRGLMIHHGVDPGHFMAYVHDVDLSDIAENRPLGAMIAALPGRKIIHTNSDCAHAGRVLSRLGITDAFDSIYDIVSTNYEPKPAMQPFQTVLRAEGGNGVRAAMFEDITHNLRVPYSLGMRTVYVPSSCDWASHGAEDEHIHFTVRDLTAFVRALSERTALR